MIIGNFTFDPQNETYSGSIKTLTLLRGKVQFRAVDKASDTGPSFRIVEQSIGGNVELGAAWKRVSKAGKTFLSVLLDDPALPKALNAALMPSGGNGAILIWSRPTQSRKQAK